MEQKEHKRRVRYKGTHPRSYQEKYKELQPEKYKDTVEKVIRKGSTPAGMHISICVKEILEVLGIQPGQTGLDATLGYGGHSSAMLKCLEGRGHLYGLDVVSIEIQKTEERLRAKGYGLDILTAKLLNFADAVFSFFPNPARLILYWRIWASPPCRLIILSGDLPISLKDLWICGSIPGRAYRRRNVWRISLSRNWRGC